jgi:hypothetical protein
MTRCVGVEMIGDHRGQCRLERFDNREVELQDALGRQALGLGVGRPVVQRGLLSATVR